MNLARAYLAQVLRRGLQLSVAIFVVYGAFGGPWRNYKLAHNHRRLVKLIEGDFWGTLYGLNEDLLKLFGEAHQMSLTMLGFPWAGRVFGIDTADPIMALSLALQTGGLTTSVALSVLIPLLTALLLGKVFCSHLCPMRMLFELGTAVRKGLERLGVPLIELRSKARFGGWVLVGGLLASFFAGTTVWMFVLPYVSLAAAVFLAITAGTTAGLGLVVGFWFVLDVAVAPGYFCHNLCPTGFLLEKVGAFPILRLHKLGTEDCPPTCVQCERACPYGLSPKQRTHRPACDNCGKCVIACPSTRLARRYSLPVIAAAGLVMLAAPGSVQAHHNKGIPHYGYYANYPQVPTEEYVAIQQGWEIGATLFNFQGLDRRNSDTPNDVKIFLYVYDLKTDVSYSGPLVVEIHKDGEVVTRFDRVKVDEEAVYSTRETLPESGDYELVTRVQGKSLVLPFHVELANDGVNWWLVSGITAPTAGIFGLALVGRRRRRRRRV